MRRSSVADLRVRTECTAIWLERSRCCATRLRSGWRRQVPSCGRGGARDVVQSVARPRRRGISRAAAKLWPPQHWLGLAGRGRGQFRCGPRRSSIRLSRSSDVGCFRGTSRRRRTYRDPVHALRYQVVVRARPTAPGSPQSRCTLGRLEQLVRFAEGVITAAGLNRGHPLLMLRNRLLGGQRDQYSTMVAGPTKRSSDTCVPRPS